MTWIDDARAITDRVIQARVEAKMSKVKFASLIGMSKQAYTPYEQYEVEFTLEQLFIISKELKVSITWLLGVPFELTSGEHQLLASYRIIKDEGLKDYAVESVRGVAAYSAKAAPERTDQSKKS